MDVREFGITVAQLCLATALSFLTGCSKAKPVAHVEKPKPAEAPIPEHVYKLGEPRPIILNADEPVIIKAAVATPAPQPAARR